MFLNYFSPFYNWLNVMLKGLVSIFLMFAFSLGLNAQQEVLNQTKKFYEQLNLGDSSLLSQNFHSTGVVMHVGKDTSFSFSKTEFMGVCPKFKTKLFQEQIHSMVALEVSPFIYTVDVEFRFYLNGKYSHCGVDHFTWIKKKDGLKIESIISTDHVECGEGYTEEPFNRERETKELDRLMNNWHKDVVALELDAFFNLMTDDFFYLGTDPGERWSKQEFRKFCEPYFLEKKQTWDFKPLQRYWQFSADGTVAWFDENLATWMEECRGSGVFQKINGEWKISQYNLTVLIENEKMKKFIKLRKK